MREVIAGLAVLVSLFLFPGSAFAYWVPDSYGEGIGSGPGRGKKIFKWMLIIVGLLTGIFFVGVQLMQRSKTKL